MTTPRQYVALTALCGTVALASWGVDTFDFATDDTATPISHRHATPAVVSSSAETESPEASLPAVTGSLGEAASSAKVSAAEASSVEEPVVHSPAAAPETPQRLVSAFPSKAAIDDPLPPVRTFELTSECLEAETCVDEYLWSLYERTPKVDTNKIVDKIKKTVKKDGKLHTIMKAITNYVVGDFTWKDPAAAQKVGMPMKDYVIGGMDPGFRLKLFRALRTIEAAGFTPGITSAFRDDYRQSIAMGNKAAADSSYHGGSRRGGFGRGLAADIVNLNGATRLERLAASDVMWKWIDAHEKELGIGRPYRDRDPPHVGPLDGKEYAEKRGLANAAKAKTAKTEKAEAKKPAPTARHAATAKPAKAEKSAKVSSLENLTMER